ncbi:MAG: glycoside hydrolase family 38 C-terminal domain-containing protein [Paracoccaceae bacterium]|nr:glycoside hydrolase family 38 C-terminal domain-containing protein [Paracoccaceae bacterium]
MARQHTRRLTREKIGSRLNLIEPMVFRRSSPLETLRLLPLEGVTLDAPICADPSGWEAVHPGSYWGRPDLNFVMKSAFSVPVGWNAERIALHLPLGVLGDIFNHPEALAYVDEVPIGSADRYHHTLRLNPGLADGRRHVLSLHGWTGHAGWPPDPKSLAKLHMGHCKLVEIEPQTQAFFDLASVAFDSLSVIRDECVAVAILLALDEAFRILDTRDPMGDGFYESVPDTLAVLQDGLDQAGPPLDVTLHGIGHAHMDIAYLWPISQIRLKNARTYSNVLRLMNENADFHFSHSQPALYEMTSRDYPEMFERIRTRVQEGRWEVMGGMWVEPDLNVPGPEALIRQMTLGRSYYREAFGEVETPVLWLPDTFGFPGQIPQLMKLAGLDWFVTNKLNWNQFNRVPWATHIWEGIDGSRVKAHILTTPRDVQYLPFPTNYKSDLSAKEVMGTLTHAGDDAVAALPICFGYGDGGGGPTDGLLAKARAYECFPGMPRFRMSTVKDALAALEKSAGDLQVWTGEHYLEGHRGVYTSQGWIKRANRQAEQALHQAEALAAMAGLAPDLTEAWKLLCLNQFHDIVTGTSVAEVYEDARRDYQRIDELADAASSAAAKALAGTETGLASLIPTLGPRTVLTGGEIEVAGQSVESGRLLYFKEMAPYSINIASTATLPELPVLVEESERDISIENAHLRVLFRSGELSSVIEKSTSREVIKEGAIGNALLVFEDRPICWDAWDIDPHYEDRQDSIGAPVSVKVIERGPIRAKIRLEFVWRSSRIIQDVTLTADSRRLDFQTFVDWHETHALLKVAFPVSVAAPEALFDIQWGNIRRSTARSTDFDAARFEVPAQKWASLSDASLEVALMNDCKYGYDVREDVLRLTLIKSATSPDPNADQGHHEFTYSLYAAPAGEIEQRNHAAYDLNSPARLIGGSPRSRMSASEPFLNVSASNVLVETLKPSDTRDGVIVRLFECTGHDTDCTVKLPNDYKDVCIVDIFENVLSKLAPIDGFVPLQVAKFQILSVLITR